MSGDQKTVIGIIIATCLILGGLLYFGAKGGAPSSARDLPETARRAFEDNDPDFTSGDFVNDSDFVVGDATAPVTLVEFSDFECPYCQTLHPEIVALRNQFSPSEVRFVFRFLPLIEIHDQTYAASRAAQAAIDQGRGNEYIEGLFASANDLSESLYLELAESLALNMEQFNADRTTNDLNAWYAWRAREFFTERKVDLVTPLLYLNGERYEGERTAEALAAAIRAQL